MEHQPVMVAEVMEALAIKPEGFYIDATFGRGGHTRALLAHLNDLGRVLVIDRDPTAIQEALVLQALEPRLLVHKARFSEIERVCEIEHWVGQVSGVIVDLGVSSPQLDIAERGFSFLKEGPLDMRMGDTGISAAEWLKMAEEQEIAEVLKVYGEEKFYKRIASAIVKARAVTPITTTTQLAELIKKAVPMKEKHKHPATRSFQAIRIFINQEMEELKKCLEGLLNVLSVGGRMAIISFHSLEDRIVKQFLQKKARGDDHPRHLPIRQDQLRPQLRLIGKPQYPKLDEIERNIRARSAVLRVAENLAVGGAL